MPSASPARSAGEGALDISSFLDASTDARDDRGDLRLASWGSVALISPLCHVVRASWNGMPYHIKEQLLKFGHFNTDTIASFPPSIRIEL